MNILGIETSCDETAAAVVKDGREVLSNVVYTQIPLHVPYGGVVPEIASRAHVEKISEVVQTALDQFRSSNRAIEQSNNRTIEQSNNRTIEQSNNRTIEQSNNLIDAVAVTYGPGLSPALIVGLNAAKGLAKSLHVPLIGINHIEAHLHTPFLYDAGTEPGTGLGPEACMPALGLAISGGHTNWIDMPAYGRYEIIGQTLDDAAGEAFDKASKLLGLGYPGGPKVDKISRDYFTVLQSNNRTIEQSNNRTTEQSNNRTIEQSPNSLIPFPKGRPRDGVTALAGLPAELCVSFSGLKTALLRYVQQNGGAEKLTADGEVPRIVASYQEAIVQAVADRTQAALRRRNYRALIVGGGVSLNSRLRAVLQEVAAKEGVELLMAKPKYCGDNGAMIAGLAFYRRNHVDDAMSLDVNPCLEVGG